MSCKSRVWSQGTTLVLILKNLKICITQSFLAVVFFLLISWRVSCPCVDTLATRWHSFSASWCTCATHWSILLSLGPASGLRGELCSVTCLICTWHCFGVSALDTINISFCLLIIWACTLVFPQSPSPHLRSRERLAEQQWLHSYLYGQPSCCKSSSGTPVESGRYGESHQTKNL